MKSSLLNNIPVKEAIEKFKERLCGNQMNLLVGAGVSMCASKTFKSWNGLLQDMVAYLYREELRSKGVNVSEYKKYYCHYRITGKDKDEIINSIIEREGVLAIPSQFVKRKGMREALEVYVEKHTPEINIRKGTIELFGKKQKVDVARNFNFIKTMLRSNFNLIFTTNYDQLLETVGEKTNICVRAADLSLRNLHDYVIKLHGNIADIGSPYGFDQDNTRRYILTQEDYDEYPIKHEAFMQLMRISLLKDCFCLVGFSGTDYNFVSWIKWVRDILEENKKYHLQAKASDIKIFFIDCFDRELDDATKQYFENYSIYRIVLPRADVKEVIGVSEETKDTDEYRRMLLERFFDFVQTPKKEELGDGNTSEGEDSHLYSQNEDANITSMPITNDDNIAVKSRGQEEIQQNKDDNIGNGRVIKDEDISWAKVYTLSGPMHSDVTINEPEANKLIAARDYFKYSSGTHYQENYLDAIYKKESLSEIEAQLALLAMEQLMLCVDEEDEVILKKIENILKSSQEKQRIRKLRSRTITMTNPIEEVDNADNDAEIYEKCLRYAFTFRYAKLKEALSVWRPSSAFLLKKALLMTLTDTKIAETLITQTFIDGLPIMADRLRTAQVANCISSEFPQKFPTRIYDNIGWQGIHYLNEWFYLKSIRGKEKIMPYGNGNSATEEVDETLAERSLQYLMEMPLFLQIRLFSVIDGIQWYKVASALFEKYPYPVLFFTATLNDKNILRRIGQDYSYSDILRNELPNMARLMFEMLLDDNAPKTLWSFQNACQLLAEIIKAVPPTIWQKYILRLWKEQYFPNIEHAHSSDGLPHLMNVALTMCNDEELFETVVCDCLNVSGNKRLQDVVQNVFYNLRVERFKGKTTQRIKDALDTFIARISNDQDYALMGNLNSVLSDEQYKAIVETVPNIIGREGIKENYINGLAYFAKSSAIALAAVKSAILNNGDLWECGINERGFALTDYLHIVEHDKVLNWSADELRILYAKLKENADKILSQPAGRDFLGWDYNELISDMTRFLNIHEEDLKEEDGFEPMKRELEKRLTGKSLTDNITENLYSKDMKQLNLGLKRLKEKLQSNGFEANRHYISMLLDRLLYENTVGMQTILNYMQYFVRDFVKKENVELIPQLTMLLRKYDINALRQMKQNVIVCTEYLILIAETLKKMGVEDDGIQKWLDIKASNVFNWVICDTNE